MPSRSLTGEDDSAVEIVNPTPEEMRAIFLLYSLISTLYSTTNMLMALLQTAAGSGPMPWWQIATGILAVPAAIIGLKYSYQLTQKTRLEITKTELEIEEKRKVLGTLTHARAPIEATSADQRSKITDFLILRFVILYLFSKLWGLAEDAITSVIFGAGFLTLKVMGWEERLGNLEHNNVALFGTYVVSKIPEILYWVFTFALTWPLFKDVNRALGMRMRDYLPWKRK